MARFNRERRKYTPVITNLAGGQAYGIPYEQQVVTLLLSSFMHDGFYETGDAKVSEMASLVELMLSSQQGLRVHDNLEFLAKAAVFARREFGMRSASHVLAAEVSRHSKGLRWSRVMFREMAIRPDDVTEILSYYLGKYGFPIPNAMKRGLADALSGYSEYQLGKYKATKKDVSLVDAVNLCHPKSTDTLRALMAGTLEPPETWEVLLSRVGQEGVPRHMIAERKRDTWAYLVREQKMGYMALLRNLRNIAEQAPACMKEACAVITSPDRVKSSLVMPFRFLSAYMALYKMPESTWATRVAAEEAIEAVTKAADISLENIPELPGRWAVCIDISGSMSYMMAAHSSVPAVYTAAMFGLAFARRNNADVILFNDRAIYMTGVHSDKPLLEQAIRVSMKADGGTSLEAAFQCMNRPYDSILLLSDMQAWGGKSGQDARADYSARIGTTPVVYSWDLAGYGTAQFADGYVAMAGMSDRAFDLIQANEYGRDALIDRIRAYTLTTLGD